MNSKFGIVLKDLRTENKYSQKGLADILKVAQNTVSQYENGLREPDNSTLIKLSNLFNVSTDYLLGQNNEATNKISDALVDDPELQAFWNTMKERDDLQLMFKKSKELSPAAIKQIIGIIKLIEDKEDEEFGK